MSVTVRGVHLGHMKLDLSLLSNRPHNTGVAYDCPVIAYIIESPEGRILWETGVAPDAPAEWLPEWLEAVNLDQLGTDANIERRLAALGLGPEDFRYVVFGHLHTDHAGGLRLFEDAGAEIVVHEREYAHVMGLRESENFFNQVDWAFLGDKKPTLVTDDGTELAGGVRLHHLPGHTPGQMAMQLELDTTGTVLLTSDALYHNDNYVESVAEPLIYWDVDLWRTSLEKIEKIAQENDALVFPGHDETAIAHVDGTRELQPIKLARGYVYS
ncbi:beta-lactamase domain protein [Pseudonocardia dioxanivorans CB1190]|uniref:Beta-lactamase domain protein n=1 Tax=Pseudonocardia dioxanivorans (strain ATCC 55486 / DSM 44775 / JCM 13855 / CB1190) TaxID=675635 RepID=F4D238_PSEUX|nr:N-acyl homoserine lactonase family protein [Pseudonocardia dioxanivorans]AEA28098.1 beta-lactamase domain protein [Pseudonocardia dioxanivorans CB1190]